MSETGLISKEDILDLREQVVFKFGDTELGSAGASGAVIKISMVRPATVQVRSVTSTRNTTSVTPEPSSSEKPHESSYSEQRYKISLPAYDDEDAKRLARALNEKIQLCGGKPDPFAK
jgi:hypothetical protein